MPLIDHSEAKSHAPIAMRDALLEKIFSGMEEDNEVFFVSADFGSPVLDKIRENFPKRFINVGIAEQNLINISSGLALEGFKVFAYAIAPFLTMRCFEQIRVNLALMSKVRAMNVNLIGVGAGYSYVVSGPTHQCYEDLTIIGALPNVKILSPSDYETAANIYQTCIKEQSIKYVRLDAQTLPHIECEVPVENGFRIIKSEGEVAIIATGYCTHTALNVYAELSKAKIAVSVVDVLDFSALSKPKFAKYLATKKVVFSIEEGFENAGGLDTKLRAICSRLPNTRFEGFGVSNGYNFELGTREELHEVAGIGLKTVTDKIMKIVEG